MGEEKQKPLNREDVLRKIKEHGGPEFLDLSHQNFEEGIDLSGLDLHKIIFSDSHLFRAVFNGSNLYGANFDNADLQYAKFNSLNSESTNLYLATFRGAHIENAEFRDADLSGAEFYSSTEKSYTIAHLDNTDLRGAKLFLANFKPCFFYGTKLEGIFLRGADIHSALHLDEADWGNYKIGEEISGDFYSAEIIYRRLKLWYRNAGRYDVAGKFYYREMEARRKALRWRSKSAFRHRLALELSHLVFGYGEGWKRILFWIAGFILFFALIYFAIGTLTPSTFLNSLYYSAVSFIALGYGSWIKESAGWVKGLGVFETFLGFFMMTLLLVTFVRKWTR